METTVKRKMRRAARSVGARSLRRSRAWFVAALSAAVLFVAVLPASGAPNPFEEVPKGHWSYGALAEFAGLGLVDGYSGDAFQGGRLITRYEMAWVIARLAQRVKASGGVAPSADAPSVLSLMQRETLARLEDEFAAELAVVAGAAGAPGAAAGAAPAIGPASDPATAATPIGALGQLGLSGSSVVGSPELPGSGPLVAIAALPGDREAGGFSGGKRLSELIGGTSGETASGSGTSGPQKKALTIPLEDGAEAELSLGGPPMPGGIAPEGSEDVIARLDLKYALSKLAIFRASYELAKDGENPADGGESKAARATALLGIDYNFSLSDSAFIKAGYTYSKITDLVPRGVEWGPMDPADQPAEGGGSKAAGAFGDYTLPGLTLDARKTTASLGVGYTFGGTASVMLGYRLIDFQELGPESSLPGLRRTNVATAELTIRF